MLMKRTILQLLNKAGRGQTFQCELEILGENLIHDLNVNKED